MELLIKIVAFCVIGAVLALLLREQKQVLAIFVIAAIVVAAVPLLLNICTEIFSFFNTLIAISSLPEDVFQPMVKVVGINKKKKTGDCSEGQTAQSHRKIQRNR